MTPERAIEIANEQRAKDDPLNIIAAILAACREESDILALRDKGRSVTDAYEILNQRDDEYRPLLQRIGDAIGYGNAQGILGELWDDMLQREYPGVGRGRGRMGVTVDDDLPPLPKAGKLRRELLPNGGYRMVPAYTEAEMRAFAHAAIAKATGEA